MKNVCVIKQQRDSSVELLRIVFMLLIVLHHYCVNSGFQTVMDLNHITYNTILIQFMAFGGKVGVNGFLLISGYYMINSSRKMEKVYKLVLEILFYNVSIYLLLHYFGGYDYSLKQLLKIIPLIFSLPANFIANYLLIYLLSPVINKSLKGLTRKEFNLLLAVLVFYFVIAETLLFQHTWNYLCQAFLCYCVGAYIKIYSVDSKKYPWGFLSVVTLGIIWISELVVDFVGVKYGFEDWTYMIGDANKLTVFIMPVFMFLYFKKLHIGYIKYVNLVAASSLGVLMIHANSDVMRQWLWNDFLKNTDYFNSPYLWLHMLISVLSIYIVCTLIDILRIKYIETPLFRKFIKK